METKNKLTAAESTLSAMAKVVLVLGIISSIIIFFTACLSREISVLTGRTGDINGFNWMGFPSLIYCVMATLVGWAFLSVIVEISINIRSSNGSSLSNWQKDFAIAQAAGLKDKAKEILYRAIFESDEFKKVLTGGNEAYHQQCIDDLNKKYDIYLKEIGESQFKHTEANEIINVFK